MKLKKYNHKIGKLMIFLILLLVVAISSLGFVSASISDYTVDENDFNSIQVILNDSDSEDQFILDNQNYSQNSVDIENITISNNDTYDMNTSLASGNSNTKVITQIIISDSNCVSNCANGHSTATTYLKSSNTSSNDLSTYSTINNYFNDNCKSKNVYYLTNNGDNTYNLEKIGTKSNKLDDITFNSSYPIFSYLDYNTNNNSNSNNYADYVNDISDYINDHVVFLNSNSNFQGNELENLNNFIREIYNLKLNKIDDDNSISIIQDFQSDPETTLTILFFIKIFMKHHDNGKEHITSF